MRLTNLHLSWSQFTVLLKERLFDHINSLIFTQLTALTFYEVVFLFVLKCFSYELHVAHTLKCFLQLVRSN